MKQQLPQLNLVQLIWDLPIQELLMFELDYLFNQEVLIQVLSMFHTMFPVNMKPLKPSLLQLLIMELLIQEEKVQLVLQVLHLLMLLEVKLLMEEKQLQPQPPPQLLLLNNMDQKLEEKQPQLNLHILQEVQLVLVEFFYQLLIVLSIHQFFHKV